MVANKRLLLLAAATATGGVWTRKQIIHCVCLCIKRTDAVHLLHLTLINVVARFRCVYINTRTVSVKCAVFMFSRFIWLSRSDVKKNTEE